MDITLFFELRLRLRAAMIAGTNLLSDDFRLKRTAESFAALAEASPVFGKINEMTNKLFSDGSPENLLDTITLVDAAATMLGTTEVKGSFEPLSVSESNSFFVNAPYSRLSAVIEALTTSGSGSCSTILTARNEYPEIFTDYRVKPALVKALGASYTELADTAANILKGMGKEIIPLVKKYLDPKGGKETVRRVNIIEEISGAEENDFYLAQLENSEKDVRKRLIYALRHDERNIDKLIELAKTEKGKAKTAALAALISFDNEKAAAFFDEYAKKKPAEVITLLGKTSSEWTSRLAARLINEALVDDKGNRITLSQAANVHEVNLRIKTSFWDMSCAMIGKWGGDIEKIYREFDNKDKIGTLDEVLGNSILFTNDDGLKKLALELNSAKSTKNCYVLSETTLRLLSAEDSSKWIAERITDAYKLRSKNLQAVTNSGIIRILRKIYIKNGRYFMVNRCYDPINEGWIIDDPREVMQPLKGEISDALMKCTCWEYARLLGEWIDENDKEYCRKLGNYFSTLNSTILSTSELYGYIKKCGMRNVKGLLVREFKAHTSGTTATVRFLIKNIPGDDEYRLNEVRELVKLLRSGKLVMKNVDVEELSAWAESGMK